MTDFNLSKDLSYAITIVNHKLRRYPNFTSNGTIPLSRIQYTILFLLVLGKSLADISQLISKVENINVGRNTISFIITNHIYRKLNVNSNGELIEKAIMMNLVNSIPQCFLD